jgi:hypothetical protein
LREGKAGKRGKKVLKNVHIYDNGAREYHRFTVVFMDRRYSPRNTVEKVALRFNAEPFHPKAIVQRTGVMPGRHLGKRIHFDKLSADCQKFIKQNL